MLVLCEDAIGPLEGRSLSHTPHIIMVISKLRYLARNADTTHCFASRGAWNQPFGSCWNCWKLSQRQAARFAAEVEQDLFWLLVCRLLGRMSEERVRCRHLEARLRSATEEIACLRLR